VSIEHSGDAVTRSLEARVRELETWSAAWDAKMTIHLIACDRRGARLERLGWAIGSVVVSTLGTTIWVLVKTLAGNGGIGP
jgi:hypothetical protein